MSLLSPPSPASQNHQLGPDCCIQSLGWGGLLPLTSLCLSLVSFLSWILWVAAHSPSVLDPITRMELGQGNWQ